MTGVPVMAFEPVTAAATPSLTLVAIVKFALKFKAGVNVKPDNRVLTSAIAPAAVQTPAANVDVTAPDVAVLILPARTFDRVKVTVTVAESTSLTTIAVSGNPVSST